MNVCPVCNTINPDDRIFCVRCGTRCLQVYTMPVQKNGLILASNRNSLPLDKTSSTSEGFAIASFIIGVISFPLSCISILFFFMLPFTCLAGITGLVFGLVSMRKKLSGMGTAGIVLNIVTILCSIALIVIFALVLCALYFSVPLQTMSDLGTKV
jgi:hypothetical protein